MDTLSPELQIILDNFANRPDVGGVSSLAYQHLERALLSSDYLTQEYNRAVLDGHLKSFEVNQTPNSAATYDGVAKSVNLNLTKLNELTMNESNFVFVLGHEIQHGFNHADITQAYHIFNQGTQAVAQQQGNLIHDYTQVNHDLLSANRLDEAKAHLAGWNAFIHQQQSLNNPMDLGSLYAQTGYAANFIRENIYTWPPTYSLQPGYTFEKDLTLKMDAANIEATAVHYFDKSAGKTRIGHNGNSDYTNFYGTYAVGRNCAYELAYASTAPAGTAFQLHLDMSSLKLNESLLEQNGLALGGAGNQCTYYDTTNPNQPLSFDHTSDGANRHVHVPIGRAADEIVIPEFAPKKDQPQQPLDFDQFWENLKEGKIHPSDLSVDQKAQMGQAIAQTPEGKAMIEQGYALSAQQAAQEQAAALQAQIAAQQATQAQEVAYEPRTISMGR